MFRHENVSQMLVQMLWRYARGEPCQLESKKILINFIA
jgi:hypothetical protein